MSALLAIAIALRSAPAEPAGPVPPRVIVVSFDGAGYALTSRLLAEGKLPNLSRVVSEGAWSDGMITSFPTKTAAAHALLFTGQHGHRSGITGNDVLRSSSEEEGRLEGTRLETVNGYFSESLRSDPVWALAARAGLDAYVLHAPQIYPFAPEPRLFLATGYTEARSSGEALAPNDVLAGAPGPMWSVPEARRAEAREIRFRVGDESFRGLVFDDPFDPTEGCDTLGVAVEPDLTDFVARVKAGPDARFSFPIRTRVAGRQGWFSLRLFELEADGSSFVLYRSGAVEMAIAGDFPGRGRTELEAFSGNAGTGAYASGGFGKTLPEGGGGEAERRLLETEEHLQSQLIAQARLALDADYRLLVLYSPVTDEVAHELYGYLDPDLAGHDENLARSLWPSVTEAFALQDRFLGVLLDAAERDSAHVLVVSDHGMAGTNKLVHLNVALKRAGLLELKNDSTIDLSRTRALALPLGDGSVAVNTVDRPEGIVSLHDRAGVLDEVRRALSALMAPGSGEPIVTRFFEPSTTGLLQPGGPTTGDLFLDFAPGYYPSTDTESDAVVEATEPEGNHIFVPTRRDMLAIFAAWGPRVPRGFELGRVRALDVTPTILDLLEVGSAPELPGKSLVPAKGILN